MKNSVQLQEIKAAVVRQKGGRFELETLHLEEPRTDEVRVRIIAAGICATDIHARDQHLPMPLPAVLGHEGSGVVERVGSTAMPGKHPNHIKATPRFPSETRSGDSICMQPPSSRRIFTICREIAKFGDFRPR